MEIREGRTIVVMLITGKLGLVARKFGGKWEVSSGMDTYTLYERGPEGRVASYRGYRNER